jgi:hypothetical protein
VCPPRFPKVPERQTLPLGFSYSALLHFRSRERDKQKEKERERVWERERDGACLYVLVCCRTCVVRSLIALVLHSALCLPADCCVFCYPWRFSGTILSWQADESVLWLQSVKLLLSLCVLLLKVEGTDTLRERERERASFAYWRVFQERTTGGEECSFGIFVFVGWKWRMCSCSRSSEADLVSCEGSSLFRGVLQLLQFRFFFL